MDVAQGEETIIQFFRGVNETYEVFAHPSAFDFCMDGEDVNSALCENGENFSLPLYNTRFLEAGQIRRDLDKIRSLVDKGFLRPRTTQIIEMEVANQKKHAVVDQPGRGAESGGSPAGQAFKTLNAPSEPVPYPGFRSNGELILPAPVIPCMKLHFVAFRHDLPDKIGKRKGDLW